MAASRREFVAEELWLMIAVLTVPVVALVGLAGFATLSGALAIVGFLILTPLFLLWGDDIANLVFGPEETETVDPIEAVKARYARGEIDEDEFDRKLDRLLDTEHDVESEKHSERER